MKTNKRVSGGRKVLVALVVLIIASLACGGGGGDRNDTVTPTPAINVGDDTASEIVDDTIEAVEEVNSILVIISEVNCKLGFDSCGETVETLDDVFSPE